MIEVLVAETTTLPEGAQVSVCRCKNIRKVRATRARTVEMFLKRFAPKEVSPINQTSTVFTQLRAQRGNSVIEMRVTDVHPNSLRVYLLLIITEIQRRRDKIKAKPAHINHKLENINDFVQHMAFNDMFIFDALK